MTLTALSLHNWLQIYKVCDLTFLKALCYFLTLHTVFIFLIMLFLTLILTSEILFNV